MDYQLIMNTLETLPNVIIVDSIGTIVYLNRNYAEILGVTVEDTLGKPVEQVIPNTRMTKILETGIDEIGSFMKVHKKQTSKDITLVCNRLVIRENGDIIGAIAMTTLNNLSEVEALKRDYLNMIEENRNMKEELLHLRQAMNPLENIIGISRSIRDIKQEITNYAKSNLPVLITGETGVGKEVIAEAIHACSNRSMNNYIKINCAAIPSELLESELFGYEEGAFSGAKKNGKIGKFELAHNGTLLLDEIGDMPMHLQVKLLRVLQEGVIDKIGGSTSTPVNVRLICSTNCDLQMKIDEKTFREDLYYRINVIEINIPPLRARKEDIPSLIKHFISSVNQEEGLSIKGVDKEALEKLKQHYWKGNTRELKHVIQRAAVLKKQGQLTFSDFSFFKKRLISKQLVCDDSLKQKLEGLEVETITNALSLYNGNKSKAAKHLNMDRSILYKKLKKYDLI